MEQENTVLCGANSYEEKYFFNEQFAALPATIKDELKIMCVLFVNRVGGILLLEFAPDGTLVFRVSSHEDDFFFDEIGSSLQRNCGETRKSFWLLWKCFTAYSF